MSSKAGWASEYVNEALKDPMPSMSPSPVSKNDSRADLGEVFKSAFNLNSPNLTDGRLLSLSPELVSPESVSVDASPPDCV